MLTEANKRIISLFKLQKRVKTEIIIAKEPIKEVEDKYPNKLDFTNHIFIKTSARSTIKQVRCSKSHTLSRVNIGSMNINSTIPRRVE